MFFHECTFACNLWFSFYYAVAITFRQRQLYWRCWCKCYQKLFTFDQTTDSTSVQSVWGWNKGLESSKRSPRTGIIWNKKISAIERSWYRDLQSTWMIFVRQYTNCKIAADMKMFYAASIGPQLKPFCTLYAWSLQQLLFYKITSHVLDLCCKYFC